MSAPHWIWWIAAVLLVGVEVFAPGASFIWLAIAAAAVGFVVLVVPALGWQGQFLVFAAAAAVALGVWWRLRPKRETRPAPTALNRRAEQYVGRRLMLSGPIVGGMGQTHLDDTMWRVAGPDLPAGTHVVVTGSDGTALTVEKQA